MLHGASLMPRHATEAAMLPAYDIRLEERTEEDNQAAFR